MKSVILSKVIVLFHFVSAISYASASVGEQSIQSVPITDLLKTVCSLDSNDDTYISWNGTVYNVEPGKRQELLFRVSGFNVARCFKVDALGGLWFKSSRELMLYLDPQTGEVLDTWTNPDGYQVPVMHVANNPATNPLGRDEDLFDVLVGGEFSTFTVNIPLFYPNPAYFNDETRPFADYANYQATELFQWIVKTKDLSLNDDDKDREHNTRHSQKRSKKAKEMESLNFIPDVTVAWSRVAPYLPWMNMTMTNNNSGYMILSATATKVSSFTDLFPVLQTVIQDRAPVYRMAPPCVLGNPAFPAGTPWATETSWTYFVKNFDDYLNKAVFPLYQEENPELLCIEDVLG